MKQNWSGSSFPKPLNKGNFTVFSILNFSGGGVGMAEVGGESGEVARGVAEVVFAGILVLLNEYNFLRKPSLSLLCHFAEVKSKGYTLDPFLFRFL